MRGVATCLVLSGMWFALNVQAAEPVAKAKEAVRKIEMTDFPGEAKGEVKKPTTIASSDELAKALNNKEWHARISKQVDFGKEKLLYFNWTGSGSDKLTHKAEATKRTVVVFHYEPGITDDVKQHFIMFVMPKDAAWRFDDKE